MGGAERFKLSPNTVAYEERCVQGLLASLRIGQIVRISRRRMLCSIAPKTRMKEVVKRRPQRNYGAPESQGGDYEF